MRGIPRRWVVILSTLAISSAVALACISPVGAPGSTVPGACSGTAPLLAALKTDILFVIDNSSSMTEEQNGIATELPAFIDELRKGAGTAHDFQVGVITTSVYLNPDPSTGVLYREYPDQSGKLQAVPVALPDGGTAPGTERVISSSDPDLVNKFARLVRQGTSGSGQETPFEAARLALTPPLSELPLAQGGNGGFLRDGARLLIVVVSDEDDCSEQRRPPTVTVGNDPSTDYCGQQSSKLTSVDTYASIFQGLVDSSGAPKQVMWAAIAPVAISDKRAEAWLDTSSTPTVLRNADCPTSFEPGFRHHAMALKFDQSLANLDSICKASYRDSLLQIAQIANSAEVVDVPNVPDPRLLEVEITRASGDVATCTAANGGFEFVTPTRVKLMGDCARLPDDTAVKVQMICAG